MASTIVQPDFQRIGTSVPAIAQALSDTAAAAIVDINALDAGREVSVKLATAAALPAGTYSNAAGTFTVTATGTLTVDGVVTALNDTILVKDQVSTFQNGQYYVSTAGAVGVSAVLTRVPGATAANDFQAGMLVGTGPGGTANPSTVFQQTSATVATLGTDAITYGRVGSVASAVPAPTAAAKMLYDNGTAYVATAAGTNAQIPVINAGGTAPVFVSMSGDASIAATGAISVTKIGGSLVQNGVATLTAGDSGAISATVTANTRILVTLKTANTTTLTTGYAALSGDRSVGAPGSFRIKAIVAAGTINVADVSTVDWIAIG